MPVHVKLCILTQIADSSGLKLCIDVSALVMMYAKAHVRLMCMQHCNTAHLLQLHRLQHQPLACMHQRLRETGWHFAAFFAAQQRRKKIPAELQLGLHGVCCCAAAQLLHAAVLSALCL
jgi:hypothetical protein